MKEIKKEIKREIIDYETIYQAEDGTEFLSEKECQKYEDSATTKLMLRLSGCVINDNTETDWWDDNDENAYKTLAPKTKDDIDTINQLYCMYGGRSHKNALVTDDDINLPVFMGYRPNSSGSGYDWVWFYKLEEIIKKTTSGKFKLTPVE